MACKLVFGEFVNMAYFQYNSVPGDHRMCFTIASITAATLLGMFPQSQGARPDARFYYGVVL